MLSMSDSCIWPCDGEIQTTYSCGGTPTYNDIQPGDMPTPPTSPPIDIDGGMVDPNSVLNLLEFPKDADPSLGMMVTPLFFDNLPLPCLEDLALDIKLENFDSFLGAEYDLNEPLCHHGFANSVCSLCFGFTFKNEIVNDCMWTAGTTEPLEDKIPSTSSVALNNSRRRLDSVSSRMGYSDSLECLGISQLNNLNDSGIDSGKTLETPSESSDTDTDGDEGYTPAENVHLDHNYHYSHSSSMDIAKPLLKALHKVSLSQADSDDEIDVVNVGVQDTVNLPRVSKYTTSVAAKDTTTTTSNKVVTVHENFSVVTPRRGRKAGSHTNKKVGRPSKATKRLENARCSKGVSHERPSRRCGGRTVSMDPMKRSMHNNMERMRRVDLRNCFDVVRASVPALQERTRAPKVLILKSAVELVQYLKLYDKKKEEEIKQLKNYRRYLEDHLEKLKGAADKQVLVKEEGLG